MNLEEFDSLEWFNAFRADEQKKVSIYWENRAKDFWKYEIRQ